MNKIITIRAFSKPKFAGSSWGIQSHDGEWFNIKDKTGLNVGDRILIKEASERTNHDGSRTFIDIVTYERSEGPAPGPDGSPQDLSRHLPFIANNIITTLPQLVPMFCPEGLPEDVEDAKAALAMIFDTVASAAMSIMVDPFA